MGDFPVNVAIEGYAETVGKPFISYLNDTLSIQCSTPEVVVHYSSNGCEPTRNDPVYTEPVKVLINGVYKARAFKDGWNRSVVDSVLINDQQVVEPAITYKTGKLWIDCPTDGSKIYYTLDGSQPTTSSTLYTVPVTLSANCEVKAIATHPDMHTSTVGRYLVYKIGNHVEIPDFTLSPTDKQTLSIQLDNNKAFTAFVMDLGIPKGFTIAKLDSVQLDISLSSRKSSSHSLTYNMLSDSTIRIMAYSPSNASFSGLEGELVQLSLQTVNMPLGKYVFSLKNAFFTTSAGTEEHFSDGEAFAYVSTSVAKPEITLEDTLVTLSCPTLGSIIYYTLDGSDPSLDGVPYTGRFSPGGNYLVKAIAVKEFCSRSELVSLLVDRFTTKVPTIRLEENVASLSCNTVSAQIVYTIDGTDPAEKGIPYTASIRLNPVKSCLIRAYAERSAYNRSASLSYAFNPLFEVGDANGDHAINVTDVATVIYRIGGNDSSRFVREAADVNADDTINVIDVVGIVSAIMGQQRIESAPSNRMMAKSVNRLTPILSIENMVLSADKEVRIPVYLNNARSITAMQFDVKVPAGFHLQKIELNPKVSSGSHYVNAFKRCENESLVLAYSMSNASFAESTEPVAFITVKADKDVLPGDYTLSTSGILLVNAEMGCYKVEQKTALISVPPTTSIDGVVSEDISSITFYSINGLLLEKPSSGVYIAKIVYKNGTVSYKKYYNNENQNNR